MVCRVESILIRFLDDLGRMIQIQGCSKFSIYTTPTHPRTSKKHGKGQTECCGQFPHRGSLAENVGNVESGWGVGVE